MGRFDKVFYLLFQIKKKDQEFSNDICEEITSNFRIFLQKGFQKIETRWKAEMKSFYLIEKKSNFQTQAKIKFDKFQNSSLVQQSLTDWFYNIISDIVLQINNDNKFWQSFFIQKGIKLANSAPIIEAYKLVKNKLMIMIDSAIKKSRMAAFYFLAGLSKFE